MTGISDSQFKKKRNLVEEQEGNGGSFREP
jgi:hypothetical protein